MFPVSSDQRKPKEDFNSHIIHVRKELDKIQSIDRTRVSRVRWATDPPVTQTKP